jgi:hypothetical protein
MEEADAVELDVPPAAASAAETETEARMRALEQAREQFVI